MKKFCTKCGHEFNAIGREVICPACKEQAAEESKKAAVMKAKRASWAGESVPVRISGRASTVIRAYGAEKSLPFAAALDALLQASAFFQSAGKAWEDITPYRSHRRDKHATEGTSTTSKPQGGTQAAQEKPVKPEAQEKPVKPVKQAAKTTSKTSVKTAAEKAEKAGKKA